MTYSDNLELSPQALERVNEVIDLSNSINKYFAEIKSSSNDRTAQQKFLEYCESIVSPFYHRSITGL